MQLHSIYVPLFLIICVSSQNVTFQNVTVEYESLEYYHPSTFYIETTNNLKDEFPDNQITRITIVGTVSVVRKNSITDLPKLEILQLQRLQIETLQPGAFGNLPLLEVLRLNANRLKVINEGVFNNLSVVYLTLEHNLIETISLKAFDNLPKLKVLALDWNKLKEFHAEWVEGKPVLASASFMYNEIGELPSGALGKYHNDIYFNNNKIVSIDNGVFGSGDKQVGELSLSDNYIEEWEENLLHGVKIRVFDISGNKLECLNGSFDNYFVAYQTRIYGNPWDCECLMKIDKWVKENKKRVNMRASIKKCT